MYGERDGNLTRNVHFGIDLLALRPDLVESREQLFNANQPSGQFIFQVLCAEIRKYLNMPFAFN